MCVLGKRLLKDIEIDNCTKEVDGTLWQEFCILKNNSNDRDYVRNPDAFRAKQKNWQCDSYFEGKFVNRYYVLKLKFQYFWKNNLIWFDEKNEKVDEMRKLFLLRNFFYCGRNFCEIPSKPYKCKTMRNSAKFYENSAKIIDIP